MSLTSDDKIWIRSVIEIAVRALADGSGGDGQVAAHNFRVLYREWQKTGMTSNPMPKEPRNCKER